MKIDLITNNAEVTQEVNKNDEFYTPNYAIEPILEYITEGSVVWCPFDTHESNYVKMLSSRGLKVIHSHLSEGKDFFKYEPKENYDYIVSNPPYSIKYEVFKRLFELGKPFAMLVGVVGLFESKKRFDLFNSNDIEIMHFDKRVRYFKSYSDQVCKFQPPFSSVYLTSNMLPKQIMFKKINKTTVQNQLNIF